MQNGTDIAVKTTPNIIREPRIYVVGRQNVDRGELDKFLGEYGMSWQTDTEIGGEQLVEAGGRLCYVSYGKGRKTNAEYVANIIESKHGSVLEHAVWNFIIAGVSRSFTHELIRHRAGWGYSQLSQRYVDESEANYVEPEIIAEDAGAARALAEDDRGLARGVRTADRGPDRQAGREGRGRHEPPQDGPRGRALRPPERDRDDDLRDGQRPRAAPLHRAARLRGRGRRDPPRGAGDAAHHAASRPPTSSPTTRSRG